MVVMLCHSPLRLPPLGASDITSQHNNQQNNAQSVQSSCISALIADMYSRVRMGRLGHFSAAGCKNQPAPFPLLFESAQYFRLTLSCSCGRRAAGGGRRACMLCFLYSPQTCCATAAGGSLSESPSMRGRPLLPLHPSTLAEGSSSRALTPSCLRAVWTCGWS